MNDEQLRQRIAYLTEHGGVYEDPLVELHRRVTLLQWLVAAALALNVAGLVARLM